ncbi:MAG: hypothetical protein VB957_08895 [Pseudomonadales bacterium]
MELLNEPAVGRGVKEQMFSHHCEGRDIPGILWTPEDEPATGIILLGHGGSTHKRTDYILSLARRLVRHHKFAAFAIDGPGHGDRIKGDADFENAWSDENATKDIVADWRSTLNEVTGILGDLPIGYFGLSMGMMMGLPLVASEPKIQAAVLGLMGTWGPNKAALIEAAPKINIPVRVLTQWDDELIPRDKCLELFGLIGTNKKAMHINPGAHSAVPPVEMKGVSDFLASHLLH